MTAILLIALNATLHLGVSPGAPGALGWGLGFTVPQLGVVSGGVSNMGRLGWGYNVGADVSWEFAAPALLIRWYGMTSYTSNARATMTYLEGGERLQKTQDATWRAAETGVGIAYLFRNSSDWVPYIGTDVGYAFTGWRYYLSNQLSELAAIDLDPTDAPPEQRAEGGNWIYRVRAGTRFRLTSWLASQTEISAGVLPLDAHDITNTRDVRRARSIAQNIWLVQLAFGLHFGL